MTNTRATFVKVNPKGQVNYHPCELQDSVTRAEHQNFKVEPIGAISDYPRHIPYNSEKKDFQEKTGRDAFEVYQYRFRVPGELQDKEPHVVMWDYTTGWVRITPFFKSLKHSKTMPAKVMTANPGLKDISHSITGGSISAQGYWIPYEAARAIAAKFCWDIRYVLTPVFGIDFPRICLKKEDPGFLKLSIERDIIVRCTEQAKRFRETHYENQTAGSPPTAPPVILGKSIWRQPAVKLDYESGYCTDTDRSIPTSPQSASGAFMPVNAPKALKPSHRIPMSTFKLDAATPLSNNDSCAGLITRTRTKRLREVKDNAPQDNQSMHISCHVDTIPNKRAKFSAIGEEARAAYTLMQLYLADAALASKSRATPHRASS
ncbi:uncharacterized protein KY384_007104 [Bacidia gigantensis]|uniref:uncharacterized protein n=1 Tax=Bacidia gigantensis TaxID=2732470 RepID=UPI001D04A3FF|nr:uncharacterized protein KY384_007104 [Bacidia gigantensis]KAG8528187.1 hypothetical protein KY384_007104 [Bacidia gigantensis]